MTATNDQLEATLLQMNQETKDAFTKVNGGLGNRPTVGQAISDVSFSGATATFTRPDSSSFTRTVTVGVRASKWDGSQWTPARDDNPAPWLFSDPTGTAPNPPVSFDADVFAIKGTASGGTTSSGGTTTLTPSTTSVTDPS